MSYTPRQDQQSLLIGAAQPDIVPALGRRVGPMGGVAIESLRDRLAPAPLIDHWPRCAAIYRECAREIKTRRSGLLALFYFGRGLTIALTIPNTGTPTKAVDTAQCAPIYAENIAPPIATIDTIAPRICPRRDSRTVALSPVFSYSMRCPCSFSAIARIRSAPLGII